MQPRFSFAKTMAVMEISVFAPRPFAPRRQRLPSSVAPTLLFDGIDPDINGICLLIYFFINDCGEVLVCKWGNIGVGMKDQCLRVMLLQVRNELSGPTHDATDRKSACLWTRAFHGSWADLSLFVCRCCDSSLCSVESRFPLKRRYCGFPNLLYLFFTSI